VFQRFKTNSINQIYAYEILQRFVLGIIGIFIPIYILQTGAPLSWALAFIMVEALAFMLASGPASYLIARIGFKHALALCYLFYFPVFLLLQFLDISIHLVFAVGVLYAMGNVFHWLALHAEFAIDSDEENRSEDSGKMIGLPMISEATAPFVGGAIMTYYGFSILLTTAMFFLFLSVVPLAMSRDHRDPMDYEISSLWDEEHRKFSELFVLRGAEISAAVFLFPLFVFYIVGSTMDAGGSRALVSVGGIAFALVSGIIAQKADKKHMIALGTIASGIIYFLIPFIETATTAYILSFALGVLFMIYYVPLYSIYADVAEDEDVLEFFAFREIFLNLGKFLVVAIASLGIFILESDSVGFQIAFVIAGLSTATISLYAGWLEDEET